MEDKKYINEFNLGDTVESASGKFRIESFNRSTVKGKPIITSAMCFSFMSGSIIKITVDNNKLFRLAQD
jgi:hypothetical protein